MYWAGVPTFSKVHGLIEYCINRTYLQYKEPEISLSVRTKLKVNTNKGMDAKWLYVLLNKGDSNISYYPVEILSFFQNRFIGSDTTKSYCIKEWLSFD